MILFTDEQWSIIFLYKNIFFNFNKEAFDSGIDNSKSYLVLYTSHLLLILPFYPVSFMWKNVTAIVLVSNKSCRTLYRRFFFSMWITEDIYIKTSKTSLKEKVLILGMQTSEGLIVNTIITLILLNLTN